jgi:DNA-binding NarL/FixJ family response regulator
MARSSATPPAPRGRAGRVPHAGAEPRIRIVVADSQAIDRGGLVGLIEKERDLEVVGEAATLEETIQQCGSLKPDVLVLSLNLPGQDQSAAIPAIRATLPALRILALSDRSTASRRATMTLPLPTRSSPESRPGGVRRDSRRQSSPGAQLLDGTAFGRALALKRTDLSATGEVDCLQLAASQGAMATLRRSADPEDLYRAIRAVSQGQAWYDPATATGMLSSSDPGKPGAEVSRLSEREMDVAALIAEGLSNKEIASALAVSEPTVKKHIGHILEKLGLHDRLQAGLMLANNPLLMRKP